MQDKYRHIRSGFDGHMGDMRASLTQIVRRCAFVTSAVVLHVVVLSLLSFLLVQAAVTRLMHSTHKLSHTACFVRNSSLISWSHD